MGKRERRRGYLWRAFVDLFRFMPVLVLGKLGASIVEGVLQVWMPVLTAEIFELAPNLNEMNTDTFKLKIVFLCICISFPALCTVTLRAVGLYGDCRNEKSYGWNMYGFARRLRLEALEEPKVLDGFRKADAAYSRYLAGSRMLAYLLINTESALVCVSTFLVVGSFSVWLLPGVLVSVLPHMFMDILVEKRRSRIYRGQAGKWRRLKYLWRLFIAKESVKEMRVMGFQQFLKEKWMTANAEVVREMRELDLKAMRLSSVGMLAKNCGYVANVALALALMLRGELAVGQFAACLTAFGLLQDNLFHLSSFVTGFIQACHHLEEYYEFFGTETEEEGGVSCPSLEGDITLRDVHFRYPGAGRDALDGVDLCVKKGEHVVVVGVNGSGKTTLSKVLTGVYRAASGSVCYDGQNIAEVSKEDLYRRISLVQQDFVHYNFSLRDNICVSDFRRREEEGRIREVIGTVGMQELVQGLGGLDSQLGREFGGRELSGGEWQKVAIARGLFKDSDLIVLDEPTSALDPLVEYEILTGFLDMIRGKTSLIISHRVGVCRHADKVVVMKEGKVVECGTHEKLKNAGGEYARIWREQAKWY